MTDLPVIPYADIRSKIMDADIALFSGNSLISRAIKRVTNSPYSHVGLLWWDGPHLMLHESVATGYRAIRLSRKLAETPVVLARCGQVFTAKQVADIRAESNHNLSIRYGWLQCLQIYLRVRFGVRRKIDWTERLICSEAVAMAYMAAGIDFAQKFPDFIFPSDIAADPSVQLMGVLKKET